MPADRADGSERAVEVHRLPRTGSPPRGFLATPFNTFLSFLQLRGSRQCSFWPYRSILSEKSLASGFPPKLGAVVKLLVAVPVDDFMRTPSASSYY